MMSRVGRQAEPRQTTLAVVLISAGGTNFHEHLWVEPGVRVIDVGAVRMITFDLTSPGGQRWLGLGGQRRPTGYVWFVADLFAYWCSGFSGNRFRWREL